MKVQYVKRSPDRLSALGLHAGRFGGGWQWKIGIQATGDFRHVIISLLVAELRIDRRAS